MLYKVHNINSMTADGLATQWSSTRPYIYTISIVIKPYTHIDLHIKHDELSIQCQFVYKSYEYNIP